jgi:hypothetical protein
MIFASIFLDLEPVALAESGRTIVEKCAEVKKGEQVLILTDYEYPQSIPQAIFNAAFALGADPAVFIMSPRKSSGISMTGTLPKTLDSAIIASDVFFVCTQKRPPPGSQLRNLRDEMLKKGGRTLNLYMMTEDMFLRTIPTDYDLMSERIAKTAKLFPSAETVEVTAPNGTNITFTTKGRRVYARTDGIALPGESEGYPAGYFDISPDESSANGTIVLDGTLSYTYAPVMESIGHILEPIECKVQNGRVVKVEGGAQAKLLGRRMKAADGNAPTFGEFYIGFNPSALPNTGVMLEDERSMGVIGVGLGRNTHVLGMVESNFHFDGTLLGGSVSLDGKSILEDMKFRL